MCIAFAGLVWLQPPPGSRWFLLRAPKARFQLCCRQKAGDETERGYFHVLFDYFCFNSCTAPFCLALQLQALRLQRLASRCSRDSLASSSPHVIVFIVCLMLILCLILLSLAVHAFSHNADRRADTKGSGFEEELH